MQKLSFCGAFEGFFIVIEKSNPKIVTKKEEKLKGNLGLIIIV